MPVLVRVLISENNVIRDLGVVCSVLRSCAGVRERDRGFWAVGWGVFGSFVESRHVRIRDLEDGGYLTRGKWDGEEVAVARPEGSARSGGLWSMLAGAFLGSEAKTWGKLKSSQGLGFPTA